MDSGQVGGGDTMEMPPAAAAEAGEDNLSISMVDFFAFLDGDEQQPHGNQGPTFQVKSETDPNDSEDVFQQHDAVLENNESWPDYYQMGPTNWQSETKTELDQADESFDHFKVNSYPFLNNGVHHSIDSVPDDFESSMPYCRQYLRDTSNCSNAVEEATLPDWQYKEFMNGVYLGDQQRCFGQMEGEISMEQAEMESKANDPSIYTDLSLIPLTEQSGLSELKDESINPGAVLVDPLIHERNLYTALPMLNVDHGAAALHASYPVMNIGEGSGSICNGNSSCVTAHGGSASFDGGQHFFPDTLSQQFPQATMGQSPPENSFRSSPMQLGTPHPEESDDTSLSECADLYMSSPSSLSNEQSNSEGTCLRSESSTDSSPVTSSRNSTSEDVGKYFGDDANQLLESKVYPSSMKHKFPKDERDHVHGASHNQQLFAKSSNTSVSAQDDDDGDLCVLEDSRNRAQGSLLPTQGNFYPISQPSLYAQSIAPGFGGMMRYKAYDERLTLQLALQDFSQPKVEATPPDGVLTVPLLRHQRIALSWMVQKETNGLHCSGGILADDQGLGKTVSTISLILTERSPSSRSSVVKQEKCEALTLDDDDDDEGVGGSEDSFEPHLKKQPRICSSEVINNVVKPEIPMVVKTRPPAGTLVVCPTSVLRQWAEELRTKVTREAKLSYLVYHGSNRTKDPNELTKYDVVLTTYAIVSMEVPKQSHLDEDEEEKGKPDRYGVPIGSSSSKKRKNPSTSKKRKDGVETSLLESAKPLARVAWFRVILDEAQSIKNYRTQVARACWGLRAKRRWCLSGTPIQNTVEDLYSYFRFLRYDPYAVYKSFCSMIKVPISRNPVNGYKKLQAVLKTVMLRRTKGTVIDGQPIINLPAKTVSLKQVDFTAEERAFYSILEAESREQFKVYADAGTVKQNYVNILLLLLRLRQACDHPLLIRGYEWSSMWRSSLEMAKKLQRDKQQSLLSCLQSCSAICTLCNDSPEDAVVTICGHVFCNQCICEHLTADDSVCPVASCRVRLNSTSLFSRGTLECCLNGLDSKEQFSDSGPEQQHAEKLPGISPSYESSKVKAALETLLSLPQLDSTSQSGSKQSNGGVDNVTLRCKSETSDGKKLTEKAIVFSQWTRMLDLLEVHLKDSPLKYRRLDGTMSVAAREKAVKDFNTNPEVTVMIMSLKAASLGLNMVAACHVLLLDLWWNPTTEDQAVDRAHRIGQTRPVTVSRLTVKDTVEDRILALQEKKREMVASAFGEDRSGSRQTRLTEDDLNYLFRM